MVTNYCGASTKTYGRQNPVSLLQEALKEILKLKKSILFQYFLYSYHFLKKLNSFLCYIANASQFFNKQQ